MGGISRIVTAGVDLALAAMRPDFTTTLREVLEALISGCWPAPPSGPGGRADRPPAGAARLP
ncbi:MAG TPA: hypothetical protein VEC76_15075 [Streptosporangiaceae bacterium]|nr:hypothetical protein [Streptosporangiaceae bacterium]